LARSAAAASARCLAWRAARWWSSTHAMGMLAVAPIGLEPVVKHLFGNDPVKVVMLGGASLLVAALMTTRVNEVITAKRVSATAS